MTKSIKFATVAFVVIASLTLAFKSADNEKKEYVTIFCNDFNKDLTLSYSNGTYKTLDYKKRQGNGDQTQILKVINEHEMQDYKLVNYDNTSITDAMHQITFVLMCK
jgi:hypothetical protein